MSGGCVSPYLHIKQEIHAVTDDILTPTDHRIITSTSSSPTQATKLPSLHLRG